MSRRHGSTSTGTTADVGRRPRASTGRGTSRRAWPGRSSVVSAIMEHASADRRGDSQPARRADSRVALLRAEELRASPTRSLRPVSWARRCADVAKGSEVLSAGEHRWSPGPDASIRRRGDGLSALARLVGPRRLRSGLTCRARPQYSFAPAPNAW
jgi:hypothetical protein